MSMAILAQSMGGCSSHLACPNSLRSLSVRTQRERKQYMVRKALIFGLVAALGVTFFVATADAGGC